MIKATYTILEPRFITINCDGRHRQPSQFARPRSASSGTLLRAASIPDLEPFLSGDRG
jgi:hypothetical protein